MNAIGAWSISAIGAVLVRPINRLAQLLNNLPIMTIGIRR
jgi:hypothetical protein